MTKLQGSLLRFGVWFCALALVTGHLGGHAQTLPLTSSIGGREAEFDRLFGTQMPIPTTGESFFEGAVNPQAYVVGPGDRLAIVFWQPTFAEYPTTVNGDGDVLIPYVGLIRVAELTLDEAREKITTAVSKALRVGRVTVSLAEPRRFRVHVTGMVEIPGTYVVSAASRVSDAIALAGGLKRERTFLAGDTASVLRATQRRIEVISRKGERVNYADLLLFSRGGRTEANPRLQDGQTIYVPPPATSSLQVGVFGAVSNGGLFEYAENERLQTLLAVAGGLTAEADSSSIRILSGNGTETRLDLRGEKKSDALAHLLHPGDRVYITGFPDTSRTGSVTVIGEVANPGGFPIVVGETTLAEILTAAGGLLPSAAANSARLIRHERKELIEPERKRLLAASLRMNQVPAVRAILDADLAVELSRWEYGTVVVDLTDATRPGSAAYQVKLHDGDVLEIPRHPLGVRVLGAVNHAGEVEWKPGANLRHYLQEAGGANRGAWRGLTMVIKARNGSLIRYESSLPIDPGDVVFVPMKPTTTTWTLVKDFVAVTAQVATVALIIQNIQKK
ncbi:SLBB domain-containing protein [bacterium]|nr:SLBB domain-containing protein [bacterium]MBU1984945.1 SLBB domain-containing protein [bacterium]